MDGSISSVNRRREQRVAPVVGIYHRFSLARGLPPGEQSRHPFRVLGKALSRPTSRHLCGYGQGNKPPDLIWASVANSAVGGTLWEWHS